MTTSLSARLVAVAALATAAFGAASAAHAGGNVTFSLELQGRPGYYEPAPVYFEPRNVYVQPRPVYVEPRRVYIQPRPVYVQPRPVYVPAPVYAERGEAYGRPWRGWHDSGYAQERAWRRAEWQRRHWDHDRRDHHDDDRDDDRHRSHGRDRD